MPASLENSAVATGLEKVSFHSNPKNAQTIAQLHSSYTQSDAQNCSPIALEKKILLGFWIKLQLQNLSA